MDKLKSMAAFCCVAETASFAATAERFNVSGPMISKRVSWLEREVGVTLLNRTTRKVSLTEAGRAYYARCRQLLDELDRLEEDTARVDRLPRGALKINVPVDFGTLHMVAAIDAYRKHYPEVEPHLFLENRPVDLHDGIFDVVIRVTDTPDVDAVGKVIRTTRLCTYASPGYLRSCGEPLSIEDLAEHQCLRFLGTPHGDHWIFQAGASIRHFTPRWCFSSNSGSVLCQAAAAGAGIFQAPDITVAPYLESGRLTEILCEHRVPSMPIYAMYLSRRIVPVRIRSFVDFLRDYFNRPEEA